ncbi:TonB-dependent receptor [Temperatibacter marinus]|uniref:TonB-dependent receptor n=1 Tax=Temperatibacter marinus TaxID=1456591 RepID=A0AA52H987_9PROT|nr:TonB-dependent receptor [Temperatibacter marinus]WND01388.1 TonB-dependent receptor [Temperatibacter marinus]
MSRFDELKKYLRLGTAAMSIAAVTSAAFAGGAYAQDDDDDDEDDDGIEEVVVTGSKLRRNPFSTTTPIQVISGETSRELGLFNTGDILQQSPQTTGSQIDNSFTGFVLDGGPGSVEIGFRGLGSARTLIMMNGRRLAPAGIGGAPAAPDFSLIPGVMVDRIEQITEGASTIYGSDAVAGVANIILKKNVEGFDIQGSYRTPESGGGEEMTVSAMWGKTFDNGYITVGGEYYERKVMTRADSEFASDCTLRLYEDENGNRLPAAYGGLGGPRPSEGTDRYGCDIFPLTNRMSILGLGSIYYKPGASNVGIPNWLETTQSGGFFGVPGAVPYDSNGDGVVDLATGDRVYFDGDGDGVMDIDLQDPLYAMEATDYYASGDFVSPTKRFNIMATGEYVIDEDSNTKVFFESFYTKRESSTFSPGAQLFENVPASSPYNPCNQSVNPDGVNCLSIYGVNFGDLDVLPIVNIRGDRDNVQADIYQFRFLAGVTGTLNYGAGWDYEVYGSYSYSKGDELRRGMNDANFVQSLDAVLDDNGNVVCRDPSNGCVPLNLFSDRILGIGGGVLTAEEEAFLISDRTISTVIKQTMFGASVTGDLFRLPWNDAEVPIIVGVEYRKDTIASDPNDVSAQGLLWGYFNDEGADGSRSFKEIFVETSLPLVYDSPIAEELRLDLSARYTDESFYEAASIYAVKGIYKPVDWMTFRGAYSTSYRAPNVRERFLNGQSGFGNVFDPCFVPEAARDSDPLDPAAPATYNADGESREQYTLDSCRANGVDPTSFGLDSTGTGNFSTEINSGGSLDVREEESTSKSYGFVIDQPFTDKFDLKLSVNWFEIEVTDAIAEPTAAYLVSQCYSNPNEPTGSSPFCARIPRDADGTLGLVDASFINIGRETAKGIDYNIFFGTDFEVAGKPIDLTFDLRATQMKEQITDVSNNGGDDNVGEVTTPEWRFNADLALRYNDFSLRWSTLFIGGGQADDPGDFDNLNNGCADLPGVSCRAIWYTEDYDIHNVSLSWSNGQYSISGGVRNIFNTAPPLVDPAGVFSLSNIPLGVGYDLYGRSFFVRAGVTF